MAKKTRKNENKKLYEQKKQESHELWMLRLKVGVIYVLLWIIAMSWITTRLPDPVSAAPFYAESKAHWFMNIGIAMMFFVIQYQLGRKPERTEHES